MTEKQKMISGKLYTATDKELRQMMQNAKSLLKTFHQINEDDNFKRIECLKRLLGSVDGNIFIQPVFRCDYGSNIFIGKDFCANYDCTILDICRVNIGDRVMFGPRVCIYTATHPIDAKVRATGLEYGKPVTIGNDVWIGGSTVINPGVTIGDNAVVGSGSVVTKDIPIGVIAAGNPCRILRQITDEDSKYWQSEHEKYLNNL